MRSDAGTRPDRAGARGARALKQVPPKRLGEVAANRDFAPGFAAAMMVKDMGLSQQAAGQVGVATPLGAAAAALYGEFVEAGHGGLDYSAIIRMIRGD